MIVNRNEDADNCPQYNVHMWDSAVEIRDAWYGILKAIPITYKYMLLMANINRITDDITFLNFKEKLLPPLCVHLRVRKAKM